MRIYSLLIVCFFSGIACAQEKDSTKVKVKDKPTIKDFIPTGLRVGADVLTLGKGYYKKSFSGWETSADIDLYRYLIAFDYGTWSNNIVGETTVYENDGNYYRIGVDVNFLKKDPDKNAFFLGIRKARSVFSETLVAQVNDDTWGNISQRYDNNNVIGKWTELTMGLKVKIWKVLWMGYTARFKFRLKTSDTPAMMPHDVPGYGRTDKISYWGFNYLVMVRLPVRKQ
jgi:hypothetical protein